VCCITYQHADFIGVALRSFVDQRTTFEFEVIVHDDASVDGTADTIRDFAERYPGLIKPIIQTENQYGKRPGYITRTVFEAARGKYIALCDGDDHWIDPMKLQKQVDAMRADPGAVGCFTDAWNDQEGKRTSYMDGVYAETPASVLRQREMVMGQNIPSCTALFLRELITPLPGIFSRSPVGDTILYVHLTRKGHLLYLPEHTAVRVMHVGGKHSLKSAMHKLRTGIKVSQLIDEMTEGKYRAELQQKITNMRLHGWQLATGEQDTDAMREWWKVVSADPKNGWGVVTKWRNYLKAWYPRTERVLAGIVGR